VINKSGVKVTEAIRHLPIVGGLGSIGIGGYLLLYRNMRSDTINDSKKEDELCTKLGGGDYEVGGVTKLIITDKLFQV